MKRVHDEDTGPEATPVDGSPAEAAPVDDERAEDLGAIPDLSAELEVARDEAARNLAAAQRWQAEFENYRRRQTQAAEEQAWRASERIVGRLMPAIDNLELAIEHTIAGGDLEHLLKGVEMAHTQVIAALASEGVEVIDPFGEAFDPNIHQAVSQKEDPEIFEHTVVEVMQRGYRLHGKVLRPAMVIVSTGGPDRPAEPAAGDPGPGPAD